MTNHIFTDGITKISFSNNNIRIVLGQNGPDNQLIEAGTLIIPGNQAAAFVNSLGNSLKQLEEQIKARNEAQEEKPVDQGNVQ